MLLDSLTHMHLLCCRRAFLGKVKYVPNHRCATEPYAEYDFASSGDFGLAALLRALIKALEAQGRGFAHGHEKIHSEPMTKAIDLILAFRGPDADGEHSEARLRAWMKSTAPLS